MNFQPPDPVCRFCDDCCSGTCEGAREANERDNEKGDLPESIKWMEDVVAQIHWDDANRKLCEAALTHLRNLEGHLQLTEEALWRYRRDAERYGIVRTHAADVTPEEMDRGADVILAARHAADKQC
jgi:hypothetical protein